jgi:methylated-DNA-[protein]-cysteine S-methyltransferase
MEKNSFTTKVLTIVSKIPRGSVLTYKEVTRLAGNEKASRAVGSIMKKNYDTEVPCHRVIRYDGKVGEYNRGGSKKKLEILKSEGVKL